MSHKYLPEHAQPALLALDLARKEAKHDALSFLDSLLAAQRACNIFFEVIENVQAEFVRLGLPVTPPIK